MPQRPLIVLADDLTGAAEIAAIAHENGMQTVVLTRLPRSPVKTDVLVFDTDTRLAKPGVASRRVRETVRRLKKLPNAGFFKKTDSVLRGPVLAELAAATSALGLRRSFLVAGNPSLGRTIHQGHCLIAGLPLNQTAFGRDPHHPARSSAVLELLGAKEDGATVSAKPGGQLPRTGVIVGDHRTPLDTMRWAKSVDRHTLPAGGADFFQAWLRTRIPVRKHPVSVTIPATPALLLLGTTSAPAMPHAMFFNGLRPPSAVRVASALRQQGTVAVTATVLTLNDPLAPSKISHGYAALARTLRDAGAFRHLLVTGGATSASVLRKLGWTRLKVVRVWGPGVVTLEPLGDPTFSVTLKPGSYLWPADIRRFLSPVFN